MKSVLEFLWYNGEISGEALSNVIYNINIINTNNSSHELDLQLMRGHRYDGAGAVSGCIRGLRGIAV